MSEEPEKKNGHSFFADIAKTVIAGVIMLVCTTVYNLVLAHIWPITIHFGEYSFNNFIFILVSIVSSVMLAVLIFALEMFYIFNAIGNALLNLITPKEERTRRKHHWYEIILDAILLASLGLFNGIVWIMTLKSRKDMYATPTSEKTQKIVENLPALKQKQEP